MAKKPPAPGPRDVSFGAVSIDPDEIELGEEFRITFAWTNGGWVGLIYQGQVVRSRLIDSQSDTSPSSFDHTPTSLGEHRYFLRAYAQGTDSTVTDTSATVTGTVRAVPPVPVITTNTDYVWRRAAAPPATPAGGQNVQQHTPAGWTRGVLGSTETENSYRSTRTRTYSDGVFQHATAWRAPTLYETASGLALEMRVGGIEIRIWRPDGTSDSLRFRADGAVEVLTIVGIR